MNILAIDQGTSATKALVVSAAGELLGEGTAPVNPHASAGGAVEQDPQELLDSIVTVGREALRAAGAPVGARTLRRPSRSTRSRMSRSSGSACRER